MNDKIHKFIEYLNCQFPATIGHSPIQEKMEEIRLDIINNLTAEQVHSLCHDLDKTVSIYDFNEGCKKYQTSLYGSSPIALFEEANKAANALIVEMAEELKKRATRADKLQAELEFAIKNWTRESQRADDADAANVENIKTIAKMEIILKKQKMAEEAKRADEAKLKSLYEAAKKFLKV